MSYTRNIPTVRVAFLFRLSLGDMKGDYGTAALVLGFLDIDW